MSGRRRDNTKGQKDRRIQFVQESFNGQNIDYPASEIGKSHLARAENVVSRGAFIEGRVGTERFSYAKLPGSGEIYAAPVQHPSSKKWCMHRGTSIWIADQDMHFWTEATAKSSVSIAGSNSTIQAFSDDFKVFNANGHFYVYLKNEEYFKMNYNNPANRGANESQSKTINALMPGAAGSSGTEITLQTENVIPDKTLVIISRWSENRLPPEFTVNTSYYVKWISNTSIKLSKSAANVDKGVFVSASLHPDNGFTINVALSALYRYTYTYLRMVKTDGTSASGLDRRDINTVILNESGTKLNYGANSRDYSIIETVYKIDSNNGYALSLQKQITYATTDVDISNNIITISDNLDTGMQIDFSTSSAVPAPLVIGTIYFAINASDSTANKIKVATTLENALAGTAIDLTDVGSGVQLLLLRPTRGMDDSVTHIGIYRTLNIKGSTADDYDVSTSTGANSEIYSWVGDIDRGDNTLVDDVSDDSLSSDILFGAFLCKSRGMEPLPSGDIGRISPGWLFTATRNSTYMYYTSIAEGSKIWGGHYNIKQYHRYDQGIQAMAVAGDTLLVKGNTQTKPATMTAQEYKDELEYIPILTHFPDGDNTTGVTLWGTIAQVEESTVMAVCSDQSVRIWSGSEWGEDLSWGWVNDEIKKVAPGAVGFFYEKKYYLWYRTDSTLQYNNKCLRLSLNKREGYGWAFLTGDKWIYPPLNTGPAIAEDSKGLQRFVCTDYRDKYVYWLETYDSYTGSGVSKTYADKKHDGGFCALGNKYFYDDLDDNSFDGANLTKDGNTGVVLEQNGRLEIGSGCAGGSSGVYNNAELGTGYLEASIRNTYWVDSADGDYKWEVKLSDDASTRGTVGDLGQGVLAYVDGRSDGAGGYTATWDIKAGATQSTNSVALSARPVKIGIKREDTKVSVLVDDTVLTSDTNAAWATLSGVKASFAASHDNASQESGFNAFNVVNANSGADCLGTDGQGSTSIVSPHRIQSIMRFAEMTGAEKNFNAKHRESHAFFKPPTAFSAFHTGFKVGWKSYQDGGTTPVESIDAIAYNGDIQNWRDVQGRTIQHELIPNMSMWRMTGFKSDYWQQDKKDIDDGPDGTTEADWQEELGDVSFWVSRRSNKNLVGNSAGTETGTVSRAPGPDGEGDSAVMFAEEADLLYSDASSALGDFTVLFGLNTPDDGGGDLNSLVELGGSTSYIDINGSVTSAAGGELNVYITGTQYDFPVQITYNAWYFIAVKREGSVLSVYINSVKIGTTTAKIGTISGDVRISGENTVDNAIYYDVRIFDSAISDEAIKYWYDNTLEGGDKIMPI